MAFAASADTRLHVMGDMLMMTGTFTDGGTQVTYGNHLTQVYAAGAHLTSATPTGVLINNGAGYDVEATSLTVDGVKARTILRAGQTIYDSAGFRVGTIASITNDTTVVLASPGLLLPFADDDPIYVMGASLMSLPADEAKDNTNVSANISVDEMSMIVVFECGAPTSALTTSTQDGRWWILGTR